MRKDGVIDNKEWVSTFGTVAEGSVKLAMKPTPLTAWENTREYDKIGIQMAKNRKLIADTFKGYLKKQGCEEGSTLFNF